MGLCKLPQLFPIRPEMKDALGHASLLVNLGHGIKDQVHPRLPRLAFEEACRVE